MLISLEQCIKTNNNVPFKGCLHIGAHLGEEANEYANNGIKNVIWIEANSNLLRGLYDKTKFVQLNSKYYNVTLSDTNNTETVFNIANDSRSSSILEFGTHSITHPNIIVSNKVKIKTKRFDLFYKENIFDINLDLYDFIKLSASGAEFKILKGFGNLLDKYPFKAIYTNVNFAEVYKNCDQINQIDHYLGKYNFIRALTTTFSSTDYGEALYLKK